MNPGTVEAERATRPLTIVWRRETLDANLEGHFIHEVLLGGIGRPLRRIAVESDKLPPLMDDMLIVSHELEASAYIESAKRRGCRNVGLLHMGDELRKQNLGLYAHADYVIRHYWFADAMVPPPDQSLGVIWVPNGYRTGVGPISESTMLDAANRTVMGFFAGQIENRNLSKEREAMVRAIETAKLPFAVLQTSKFAGGLGPVAYAGWLPNSRFALVPGGNSPETVRLYEALEAGAIPIMLKSPFVTAPGALDNPPILLLDSWEQLAEAYAPYDPSRSADAITRTEQRRRAVVAWWSDFKLRQRTKVAFLVERSFQKYPKRGGN